MQSIYINIAGSFSKIIISSNQLLRYIHNEYHLVNKVPKITNRLSIRKGPEGYVFRDLLNKRRSVFRKSRYMNSDIDFMILAHLSNQYLNENVLFLHGSYFVINNKAYACIGPSGSGKTTIALNIPKKKLRGDDTVIIKKLSKDFVVYSSPFDKPLVPLFHQGKVPLVKIFVLIQSNTTKTVHLTFSDKVKYIVENYIFTSFAKQPSRKEYKEFNSLLFDLIDHVKIEQLHFTKSFNIYNHV